MVENVRHIIGFGALERSINARKDSKCSWGSVVPSYRSMWFGGLKCSSNGATIIARVNGWFSSRQEDWGLKACVGVTLIAGWNGLYWSCNSSG